MTGKGKGLKTAVKTLLRQLFITLQFFGDNGLANHAAAGAYGFLLSAVPVLLLVSFFLLAAFRSSPETIIALLSRLPLPEAVLDERLLGEEFKLLSQPGIHALISILSIFWAGRVFAASMQRGLGVVFHSTEERGFLAHNLVTAGVELLVLVLALVMILGSRTAWFFFNAFGLLPDTAVFNAIASTLQMVILPLAALGLVSYYAYLKIPVKAPGRGSALRGTLCCIIPYHCAFLLLTLIVNQTRYNFLYGALGSLIILLVNVYFFFVFFFFGAQFAFVADTFDALLFAQLRQVRKKAAEKKPDAWFFSLQQRALEKLFFSVEGPLEKYLRRYRQGDVIFSKGDSSGEIYYTLEGKVNMVLPTAGDLENPSGILPPGSFFGEMGHLLSEERSVTVRAHTDTAVLALSPRVFDDVLKYDTSLDRAILENLSRRLKNSNEQIRVLTKG